MVSYPRKVYPTWSPTRVRLFSLGHGASRAVGCQSLVAPVTNEKAGLLRPSLSWRRGTGSAVASGRAQALLRGSTTVKFCFGEWPFSNAVTSPAGSGLL